MAYTIIQFLDTNELIYNHFRSKFNPGKSKAVLLHGMEAHGGEKRYSSYSYLTSALDGGEWSASRPGRTLPPVKEPLVPTGQEAPWVPEPVWTQRLEEKSSTSVRDRTPVAQSTVSHYTDWATPAPFIPGMLTNNWDMSVKRQISV
jgi:hypothetical protein